MFCVQCICCQSEKCHASLIVTLLLASNSALRRYSLPYSSAVTKELKAKNAKSKGKKQMSTPLWKKAFVIHAVAWFMQIVPGHKYAEGVKPALIDSLGQALGVAPLFAFLEGIWFVGLAPELKTKVLKLVTANRAAMCAAGGIYTWC